MISIYVGSLSEPDYLFQDDQVFEITSSQAVAIVGQELSIDTFAPIVADSIENTMDITLFASADDKVIQLQDGQIYSLEVKDKQTASDLIKLPDGTPVWYYRDRELVGKFYLETVKRQAKNKYQLNCVSAIGRLDKMYHGGGLFRVSTFGAVLRHILAAGLHGEGQPVIEYVVDPDVESLTVSGWLPYDTKRNNLYQLIFAYGVNIIKNTDGNPRFTFVYTMQGDAEVIPEVNIFYGGNVEYVRPYSSVSIMEHTYSEILSNEYVTLYDNTDTTRIDTEEIWFDQAPVIVSTLAATDGLTIHSATENSAILSGNGKLVGLPYTHTTRTVTRANAAWEKEKTASVLKCTMVNEINSQNLLNRLFAFYCPQDYIKKISNEIIFTTQRPGKQYQFINPYKETEHAILTKMENRASSFNRASCEFYAGFDPVGQAGLFQHCIILDKATFERDGGIFSVPVEVFDQETPQMRVVLIAGGTGGSSGWPGKNGKDARTYTDVEKSADISGMWYGGEGGDGGNGGSGGAGGRVYSVTIQNPEQTYQYTIGTGGEGGAATGFIPDTAQELRDALENEDPDHQYSQAEINQLLAQEEALTDWDGMPNAGAAGTATTFGTYSTDDPKAYVPVGGVYNPLYGEYYALAGKTGIAGGKGGARKIQNGNEFTWVTDGEDVVGDDGTVYRGGSTGIPLTTVDGLPEAIFTAYGGNGAGAAVGIDRLTHEHINGSSDQETYWEVTEDGV